MFLLVVLQVLIACQTYAFQQHQDLRDEIRRGNDVDAKATAFIQKYNSNGYASDILLLPLCIAAYKYNPLFPYRRKIYREFCALTEEEQNKVLKKYKVNIISKNEDSFYIDMYNQLCCVLNEYYSGDDAIYYAGGKYFKRAIERHGRIKKPELRCAIDKEEAEHRQTAIGKAVANAKDMDYDTHINNLMQYHKSEKPVSLLFDETTNMGIPRSADELLVSYLCCSVAKQAVVNNYNHPENNYDCYLDYTGDLYMEDVFLESLLIINEYCFNKRSTSNETRNITIKNSSDIEKGKKKALPTDTVFIAILVVASYFLAGALFFVLCVHFLKIEFALSVSCGFIAVFAFAIGMQTFETKDEDKFYKKASVLISFAALVVAALSLL